MTSKKEISIHHRWEVVSVETKLKRERKMASGGVTTANISELERVLSDRSLCEAEEKGRKPVRRGPGGSHCQRGRP